jgi:hypothetical protein
MSAAMTLNGARALSVRLFIPERGAWLADVDLDPELGTTAPTGKVTLTIGAGQLVGTVDPRFSGRFASGARLRVVAGGGGWDHPTKAQHFHNDAGVKDSVVESRTAAAVGETMNVPSPASLGADFARDTGAAARVFEDRDWYVDLAGVTQAGLRPTSAPDATLEVLGYDAVSQRLEVSCDAVVLPGTTFTDARFDGTLVARDVEQFFSSAQGARATVLVTRGPRAGLADVLRGAVEELGGLALLRVYRYRFVSATADRLNLQAVEQGAPDLQPVPVWPGIAGAAAKLTPSQTVLVAFLNGRRSLPVVVGFDGALPKEVTLDATDAVHIAPSGGTPRPIARAGDTVEVYLPPLCAVSGTVGGAPFVGTMTIVTPAYGIIADGSAKADCG